MPEMRPFPGCIAEFDGYTYTGIGRAKLRFDTVEVMKGEMPSHHPGPALASQPRCRTATAPNPHVDTNPENGKTPPSSYDSDKERHPSSPS